MNGQNNQQQNNLNELNSMNLGTAAVNPATSNQSNLGTNNNLNTSMNNINNVGVNNLQQPLEVNNNVNQLVDNINVPQEHVESLESLDSNINESLNSNAKVSEPVAQPIPGTEASLLGETVGTNNANANQDNLNANNYINPNKVESIGTIPPSDKPVKNKKEIKPINKIIFVIIVVALIIGVAFGVYYFLNLSNSAVVTLKTPTLNLGDSVSDDINDYATIKGNGAGACTLSKVDVNPNEVGEYSFTISCNKKDYTGKVLVIDEKAPEVSLNIVYKTLNDTATVEEFVNTCSDPSDCEVSFVDEAKVSEYLGTAGGPHNIDIRVTDSIGNYKDVVGLLYVTPSDITFYTTCSSKETNITDYNATKQISDFLPLGYLETTGLSYLGISRRIYTYKFTNKEDYLDVSKDKTDTLSFDGVEGMATYDDENLVITISTDLSVDTLNSESNGTFPVAYAGFTSYYTSKGYTCSNQSATNNN